MNKDEKILRSDNGFSFTSKAVDKMAAWSEIMQHENCVAVWQVHIGTLNEIRTCLAGERKSKLIPEFTTEDAVSGVQFYWIAEEHTLRELRNYCIHIEEGKPSSVIPLAPDLPDRARETLMRLQEKAEQGSAQAQFDLGGLYLRTDIDYYQPQLGVKQDCAEAMKWFRMAAEQGHVGAQSRLGDGFSKGWGVKPDYLEALKWYRLAAAQGDTEAQRNIDLLSAGGYGQPQK